MGEWVKIIEVADLVKANVINAALHAQNIDTQFISRKDSAFEFMGAYDIYVQEEAQEQAQSIIDDIDDIDFEAELLEDE